ncbi:MAG: hypothetical protein IJQ84_06040 [Paludibacteraceae bacterium]|nr:hypothetical protein [Paludibacteraceae bacterium]MBR0065413.1 hypothetical protein [Paludibacteraceae bacterium]
MTPEELLEQERKAAGQALTEQTGTPQYATAADFDARLTRMLMEDERKEREKQEKRIQRQQMAQSLTDLGAVFGDVIKASGGALVTPRDMQARYDQLDNKQKMVYDNYRARMDVLRQQALARAKGDRDAAGRAKQREEEMEQRRLLAELQEGGRNQRAKEAAAAKVKVAQEQARARVTVKKLGSGDSIYTVPFSGTNYDIPKSAYDGRMGQLYAYLDSNNLFPQESGANDDLKAVAFFLGSGSNNGNAPESSKQKVATACLVAIHALAGNREHEDNIIAILQGKYNKQSSSAPVQGHVR